MSLCGDNVDTTDIIMSMRPTCADATTCVVTDRDMQMLCTDMMMSNPSAAAVYCDENPRCRHTIVCDVDGDGDGDADADDADDADV